MQFLTCLCCSSLEINKGLLMHPPTFSPFACSSTSNFFEPINGIIYQHEKSIRETLWAILCNDTPILNDSTCNSGSIKNFHLIDLFICLTNSQSPFIDIEHNYNMTYAKGKTFSATLDFRANIENMNLHSTFCFL